MKKGPVYLHLSRGSQAPRLHSTDNPNDGLEFGPYHAIRFSDHQVIYLERDGGSHILRTSGRGVYYDGEYYSECSIIAEPESSTTAYEPERSEPPHIARGEMTLEARFDRLVLLCESVIEDRLSILCEDDPVLREELLTSDIDDQIGHWQAVQKELTDLR